MLYSKETYQLEQQLAKWCMTGKSQTIEGAKAEGLKQYRRLLRNNINNAMAQAFPISKEVLTSKEWDFLIDDFFANHKARTSQIWKLPYEFYKYIEMQSFAIKFNKPYLNDLLHFEWMEIEVHTMQDSYPELYKSEGDMKLDNIEVNPEYRLIKLNYPVHLYAAEESQKHEGNYFLLVYRHPDNFEVKFIDLPVLHTLFFEKVSNEGMCISHILTEIVEVSDFENKEALEKNITDFATTMFEQKVFLGYKQTYQN